MTFSPFDTVAAAAAHHRINPAFLITALLDALSSAPRLKTSAGGCHTGVMGEIGALCCNADPPRSFRDDQPASVMEVLEMALAERQRFNEAAAAEWDDDDDFNGFDDFADDDDVYAGAGGAETAAAVADDPHAGVIPKDRPVDVGDVHRMLARGQKVLRLVLRESMNQLENEGLAAAIAMDEWSNTPSPDDDDDWSGDDVTIIPPGWG